jgi:hypothetical protein
MADLLQIISSNYVTMGSIGATAGKKYVNVDPAKFEGSWNGKYADGKAFTVAVSNIDGFRATAKYESGGTVKYQNVLIASDNTFRVGDSKFTLTKPGTAQIKTVITDANGQSRMETAYAKQNG